MRHDSHDHDGRGPHGRRRYQHQHPSDRRARSRAALLRAWATSSPSAVRSHAVPPARGGVTSPRPLRTVRFTAPTSGIVQPINIANYGQALFVSNSSTNGTVWICDNNTLTIGNGAIGARGTAAATRRSSRPTAATSSSTRSPRRARPRPSRSTPPARSRRRPGRRRQAVAWQWQWQRQRKCRAEVPPAAVDCAAVAAPAPVVAAPVAAAAARVAAVRRVPV